jgi:hypothetical protein
MGDRVDRSLDQFYQVALALTLWITGLGLGMSFGPGQILRTLRRRGLFPWEGDGRLRRRLGRISGAGRAARPQAGVAGWHALVQNLRRGHYELAVEERAGRRLAVAFDELALVI